MTTSASDIAAGFDRVSPEQWRALAKAALKGESLDSLVRQTADGLARGPVFFAETADVTSRTAELKLKDRFLPWDMGAPIPSGGPASANKAALEALEGGASALITRLDPAGRSGIAARNLSELKTALNGVMLDLAGVWLFDGDAASAALLAALWKERSVDRPARKGGFGLSPVGQAALTGVMGDFTAMAEAARWTSQNAPGVRALSVRADIAHEAGGTEAQELSWAAGETALSFRELINAGMTAQHAGRAISVRLSADADLHLTIAKLRAARRILTAVYDAFGANPADIHLQVFTSRRMMSAQDAWTNLLRVTSAALGAACGGADQLIVRPLTEMMGAPTGFALRMARNIQVMLAEESHAGRVADPAGGSFLHESLSEDLAQSAWRAFQEIERDGGLMRALGTGRFQTELSKACEARMEAYSSGETLIGVNSYRSEFDEPKPAAAESAPAPLDGPVIPGDDWAAAMGAAENGARLADLDAPEPDFEPVRLVNWAEALND